MWASLVIGIHWTLLSGKRKGIPGYLIRFRLLPGACWRDGVGSTQQEGH